MNKTLVYTIAGYEYFAERLSGHPAFCLGRLERKYFADGERWLRITDPDLRGRDAVLVGGTIDDRATLELFDLASGLVALGVDNLSLVIPYFGYSTQERALQSGEVVTAKSRAMLLSAIPRARHSNEVVMLDLHTAGIAHYFEGHVHTVNLSARQLALRVLQGSMARGETVVACTDAGRAKWVQSLANEAGIAAAFVYKARRGADTIVTGINADIADRHVVLFDDMVRSGGSLLQAGKAYKDAGAQSIIGVTTHAVLPGDALDRIHSSGLFEALYCTDSVPQANELAKRHAGFLKVEPVADIYIDYLTKRLL